MQTETTAAPEAAAHNEREPVIVMEHVKKKFGDNEVLKDINLQLNKGENLVILGRSGQGKSVTIKCLIGLLEPDAGHIEIMGQSVTELGYNELKELRLGVGFLFQSGSLYDSMSVRDNLEFPLIRVRNIRKQSELDRRVAQVLEEIGLPDIADKMPSGLSGGMRKRVALARALILHPKIMLYDEPTTGLDTITSKEISQLIMDMKQRYETSSIIITHDMSCARITADRILVMNEGVFIASGTYDELEQSEDAFVRSFFK
jgi:phospholipid/cholesterol/gamma-HCH transport system ATP-binding protein